MSGKSSVLGQYRGKLSAEQITEGMNAARTNARELADDARLLLDAKRYARAASLAILSIEEFGKVSILRGLLLARTDKELTDAWKDYRTHSKKNASWILPDLIRSGAGTLDDLRPIFDPASDHPQILEAVKQIGFYTDCLASAHWSIPSEVVDQDLCRSLVTSAEIFAQGRETSIDEMRLWEQHLKPVWGGPTVWLKNALLKLNQDLEKLGIDYGGNWDQFVMGSASGDGNRADEES